MLRHYGWSEAGNPARVSYLNEHMAPLARRLQELGVIDRILPDPLPVL